MSQYDDALAAGAPMELNVPLGLVMFTQRAIRRFKPDPVPEHMVRVMLEAAGKAPSGGNMQSYRFLCVTDPDRIHAYGQLYRVSWWAKRRDMEGWSCPSDMPKADRRRYGPAMQLADEMASVPAIVFVLSLPPHFPESVIPATQNLMLAGRALGIGSVPTRLHEDYHDEFRRLFDIPSDAKLVLGIPIGYPAGRFGPTQRQPTWATSYFQSWGQRVPWAPNDR